MSNKNIIHPYTPIESLKQSLKEMQLIRKGKIKKRTWKELKEELRKEDSNTMHTYIVKSDEQFFNQFKELKYKLTELSCIFQNPEIEISYIEMTEWNSIAMKLRQELSDLIFEANKRTVLKKE